MSFSENGKSKSQRINRIQPYIGGEIKVKKVSSGYDITFNITSNYTFVLRDIVDEIFEKIKEK